MDSRSIPRLAALASVTAPWMLVAFAACSSQSPTDGASGGTTITEDGSTGTTGDAGRGDAGNTDAATETDGGRTTDTGSTPPGPLGPRCADLVTGGGAGQRLATLDAPGLARFDGVTSVLLSIAWTTSAGDVWVGDRGSPFAGYDGEKIGDAITSAGARAALAADGHSVAVVSGATLTAYARTRPGAPWTGPSPTAFAAINTWLASRTASPAEPMFGSSAQTLFFLSVPTSGAPDLCESAWDDAAQAWKVPLVHAELASADAAHRRRPTGASWDDLTLFFWDETTGIERQGTRAATTGNFTTLADVGPFPEAVPDQACRLLYYQGSDGSGPGVFSTSGAL